MRLSRTLVPAVTLALVTACGGKAGSDDPTGPTSEKFSATLSPGAVVPATTSTSTGAITFSSVPGDSIVSFSLSVTNMAGITQAHLHSGAPGASGAILAWLLPVNGTAAQTPSVSLDGVISLGDIAPSWVKGTPRIAIDSVKALMRKGLVYVDVHSSTFTNGELRGQLAKLP